MNIDFTNDEIISAFNQISDRYFNRNFGMMSKADFETLLFHIYIEHLLNNNLNFDDYSISKDLGISQAKVRSLKIKKELQYPHQGFNWKEAFSKEIIKAEYEDKTRTVNIPINDPNVLIELRYFVEINGWYDIHQRNPKVFTCRIDEFIKLCSKLSENEIIINNETARKLKNIEKDGKGQSAISKICCGSLEEGVKELAVGASQEVLLEVLKLLPFGGIAAVAIDSIIKVIERS